MMVPVMIIRKDMMKYFLLFILVMFFFSLRSKAEEMEARRQSSRICYAVSIPQESTVDLSYYNETVENDYVYQPVTTDSGRQDSAAAERMEQKLLPANMSFMERGLWGEHGLFRSIGLASSLTPEVRKSELGLRRTMLTMHQVGGFVTLGVMLGACYYGQRVIDGNSEYRQTHQSFVAATIVSYSLTGLLSVLSPPPLIRRDEISTTTIHKTLAWVHFAGMILTPILAGMIDRHADYDQRAHVHQVAAYITTIALTASMIIITF
jgi:hypothetical protein